eukprot:CAMPEP_0184484586 /NCGR_PEP_ID=MMETSP0113_2-20130426/6286_1 /TAXON_ID=91329 /ORGANISM="Norrisiella sphaerica, Strain BC52" /LENGTH=565 /DNA_ID=CAMNT_0026865635 /DNA_START=338 /DNA_END=2035 /DNA_ORIENTATION=-
MQEAFLEQRRKGLELYLREVIRSQKATSNVPLMEFLGFLSDHSKESKRKRIQADMIRKIARPGDIVLMRTQGTLPALQRTFLSSQYDHVGVVITKYVSSFSNVEGTGALYLLESTNEGVHAYPLKSRLRAWHLSGAVIVIRCLSFAHKQKSTVYKQLQDFGSDAEGKGYALNPLKLLKRKGEGPQQESYFCSELVASAYQTIGFLPRSLAASGYYPSTFAERNSSLVLQAGATLSNEVMIEFWQPEVLRARVFTRGRVSRVSSNPPERFTHGVASKSQLRQRTVLLQRPVSADGYRTQKSQACERSHEDIRTVSEGKSLASKLSDNSEIQILQPTSGDSFKFNADGRILSVPLMVQISKEVISRIRDSIRSKELPNSHSTGIDIAMELLISRKLSATLLSGEKKIQCDLFFENLSEVVLSSAINDNSNVRGSLLIPSSTPKGRYRIKIAALATDLLSGHSDWFKLERTAAEAIAFVGSGKDPCSQPENMHRHQTVSTPSISETQFNKNHFSSSNALAVAETRFGTVSETLVSLPDPGRYSAVKDKAKGGSCTEAKKISGLNRDLL